VQQGCWLRCLLLNNCPNLLRACCNLLRTSRNLLRKVQNVHRRLPYVDLLSLVLELRGLRPKLFSCVLDLFGGSREAVGLLLEVRRRRSGGQGSCQLRSTTGQLRSITRNRRSTTSGGSRTIEDESPMNSG
jgi:hypothetical protein